MDQYGILQTIASNHGENVTHIKPHGALNNMACEDIDLATTIAKSINEISKFNIFGPNRVQKWKKLQKNLI